MKTYEPNPNDCRETDFDDFENYPCDLCALIDYTDNPPPGMFDSEEEKIGNPFCETILRKIGGTWYSIRTECDGTETLVEKVKRLIFNDPLNGKVVLQG